MEVGQQVEYLPDACHAQNRCKRTGDFPWVMGLKRTRIDASKTPPEKTPWVEELTDGDAASYFDWLRKIHPEAAEREKQNLVFVRPKAPWRARVMAVNEDETVDLAVESNQGGVTLNYPNVPIDGSGTCPHTCRARV